MEKKTLETRDKFIEAIGTLGESIGLNRTVCQIYALLYINPEPLSPSEICKILAVSKGNISINMKKLEEWNAVKKVWRKGYARSLYKANEDIEEIVADKLKDGIEKRASQLRNTVKHLKTSIKSAAVGKEADKKTSEYYLASLKKIENFLGHFELFTQNMDVLKSFLKK